MSRSTIDYGIDLGTTNSAIAVLDPTDVQIVKSSDSEVRMDYTPSAIWFDKHGRSRVGRVARERAFDDTENVASEFKLKMGTDFQYTFANTPQKYNPEMLSAEVLKALRRDVKVARSEDIDAAVITVPAAFELPQCDATTRAAASAGFSTVRLLQEPVAAALAYGFDNESDNVFWLVYDLGGGTFDAAVVKVRDGEISVVNHKGDNHLGGKFLDWDIVDKIFIPAIVKQHRVSYFDRGNIEWKTAIAKLKLEAERAKIKLSAEDQIEVEIEGLSDRSRQRTFDFNLTLRRSDLEPLMDPIIDKTLVLCRNVLREKNLAPGNIAKVLCVGGPTLTPQFRQRIADKASGLGISLEFKIDPLTVVARGAAIFAGTQRLDRPVASGTTPTPGTYNIALEYKPAGPDTEPSIGGRVANGGRNFTGFTLEFVNPDARPAWRSGQIGLSPDGVFMTQLWAEKGRLNTFNIELRDPLGGQCVSEPTNVTYRVATVFSAQPLNQSVGIALVDNTLLPLIAKGTALPAKAKTVLLSAVELRPGSEGHVVKIPVVEGDNARADRNVIIGSLVISGSQVRRTVPIGSEIELLVEIDESRQVRTKAYVPILDEEFEAVIKYEQYRAQARDPAHLQRQLETEKKRLEGVRGKTQRSAAAPAQVALQRIDGERILHDAERATSSAGVDQDEADRAEKRILELRAAVDEVEEALAWPQLIAEAERELAEERRIIDNNELKATAEEKAQFASLEAELRSALAEHDREMVRRKKEDLDRLGTRIVLRQPAWWVQQLNTLEAKLSMTTDPAQAQRFMDQGRRAINNDDVEGLKAAVRQIIGLLPSADPDRTNILSGVMKRDG